jgi:hypothetical protein
MLIHRAGDYRLEATRPGFVAPGDCHAAWFITSDGSILGFGKGADVTDACCDALDEWMNDAGAEKDEPTLDAWHAMRSHLIGLATGVNIS